MRKFRLLGLLGLGFGLAGCWNGEPSSLTTGEVDFTPAAGVAEGWSVKTIEIPELSCPDGTPSSIYAVSPSNAEGAQPTAILLHSGALDWVIEPDTNDSLAGDHFSDPSRLSADFTAAKVFATLGMYPDPDVAEASTGAMPLALADAGVSMLLPGNCWGDIWHNAAEGNLNDATTDGFVRRGADAADWAYRFASEPGFATANRVEPPFSMDPDEIYLVGLGEGGRGVSELLAAGADPAGAVMDSTADDLRSYYANTELYGDILVGLGRIFPDGQDSVDAGSLHDSATPLPARIGYVYSTLDGNLPGASHDAAIARLVDAQTNATADVLIQDTLMEGHIGSASDYPIAGVVTDFLTGAR